MMTQNEITIKNAVIGTVFVTDDGYEAEITGIDPATKTVEFVEVNGERSGNLYVPEK